MFEKLLQKILKDVIGQFTQQIDVNNLSVAIWSGEIQINKVKLNPNLFKKFGIPITIIFSHISQLKIKIPWKSFFSSPLTINIQSAIALCRLDQNQMSLQQKKKLLINSLKILITAITNRILQKGKKQQQQESGYFQSVFLKMFDNLYLNIKNINFRFQNENPNFSFGLSIKSIDIHAVDQKNNPIFIDRSKMKDNQKTIRRIFDLSKLQLYWNCNQTELISHAINNPKMSNLKNIEYAKQIQKKINQRNNPSLINIFYLNLQGVLLENNLNKNTEYSIEIIQQKIQLNLKKQIIQQFLYFLKNLQQITVKINTKVVSQCSIDNLRFLKLYCQQFFSDNKVDPKLKDQKLTKITVQNYHLIKQLLDLDKDKLKLTLQKIIEEDIGKQRIYKFYGIKQTDVQQNNKINANQIKKDIKINLNFKLPKLLVYLFSLQNKILFELNLSNTLLNFNSSDLSSKVGLNIKSLQCFGKQNNLIASLNQKQKNSIQFNYNLQKNVSNIQIQLSKITFVYDPNVINSIKQFFVLSYFDANMKNKTLDKLDTLENNVSNKIKNNQNSSKIKILFRGLEMNLISYTTQYYFKCSQIKSIISPQQYNFDLQQISLDYSLKVHDNSLVNLIAPFDINLTYKSPISKLSLDIDQLIIKIDKECYNKLSQVSKIFSGQQKSQMIKKAEVMDQIFVKQNRWKKTLAVLYRGKLYLWNLNEEYPKFILRIRKAKQIIRGKLNYLVVSDKKKQIQIAFKTQKQSQKWKLQIQKIVQLGRQSQRKSQQTKQIQSVQSLQLKQHQQSSRKSQNIRLELSIKILVFILCQPKENNIKFSINSINLFTQKDTQNNQEAQKTFIKARKFQIQFNQKRILQNKNKLNQDFLNFKITNFNENNQINMMVVSEFNSFQLNFDPVFMIKLNQFLFQDTQTKDGGLYVNKTEEILDKQDQNKILLQAVIKIKNSQMICNNKKSGLDIISFSFNELNLEIKQKYYEFLVSGIAKKFVLADLTGYPYTIYQHNTNNMNINQSRQFTKIFCQKLNQNRIQFQFQNIQKGSSKYSVKKNQFLKIYFHQFKLNYVHQLFFRVVDYFFVQLIGSISSPEFFQQYSSPQNKNQSQQKYNQSQTKIQFNKFTKKKDQLIRIKSMAKIQKKKLQQYILNLKPLYLQIKFIDSVIHLASLNCNEGLQLSIRQISMVNDAKLVDKFSGNGSYRLYTPCYKIQATQIKFILIQKQKKSFLNQQDVSIKFQIEMFNKDLEYAFIYGQKDIFTSNLLIKAQLEPCHLCIKSENISSFQKLLLYNFSHNDGLDFIMIYDFIDLNTDMIVSLKLFSDSFCFQLIHEEQKIIIDAGNFIFHLQKSLKQSQTHLECQYLVIHYENEEGIEQILTSRKNFGKFQARKTFFRSLMKSNQLQKQNKQSIFTLQIKQDFLNNKKSILCQIEQVLIVFNENLPLMLKKMQSKKQKLQLLEKAFKEQQKKQVLYLKMNSQILTTIKLLTNNIVLCLKFRLSKTAILAFLMSSKIKLKKDLFQVQFPTLQGFITNQKQISNENIGNIKKRIILRQTSIKYHQNNQNQQFKCDRLFFKISVTDIKQIGNIVKQINQKIGQITKSQKRDNSNKKSSVSGSNQSQINISKNISQNLTTNEDKLKSKLYKFEILQLMIINDNQTNLTPLLYGKFQLDFNKSFQMFELEFKLDFFNIRNLFWQPLVQNVKIQILFYPFLKLTTTGNQLINVNISTNFLQNIYKTTLQKNNKIQLYQIQQISTTDQINSWIVSNQMGQSLIFRSIDRQNQIFLSSNQSANVNFLNSSKQNFTQNKVSDKEVFINLIMNDKLEIKQLNINQFGLKKMSFIYKDKKVSFLKKLSVDISKNVRYLTFSSTLQIQNKTDLNFKFYIISQSRSLWVSPNSSQYIPFDLSNEDLVLENIFFQLQKRQTSLQYSQHIAFHQLQIFQQSIRLDQIEGMNKLKYKNMSFRIKTKYEHMKKIISFQPLYVIKNYLPHEIMIVLKDKSGQNMLNQYFIEGVNSQNNTNFKPIYHQINETQVSFYIQGYQWTNFQQLQNRNKILFRDYSNKLIEIKISQTQNLQSISEIIIYYPLTIKNKSLQATKILYKNDTKKTKKQLKTGQSQLLLSRDVLFQLNDRFSQQIYLKNGKQFFIFNKKINNLKSFSKYIISKNVNKIKQNITITQFKLFNKYLINNSTQTDIVLKPQNGRTGQIQIINKGEITDLLFFEIDKNISIGSIYRFCPKQTQYQWSHSLNLTQVKQTPFFIRSRFQFTKKKHFILQVTNRFQNCLEIIFKQINNEVQIPFLLCNQTEQKIIYVRNVLQQIQPGKQIFFNWDDPLKNSNLIYLQIKGKKIQKISYTLDISRKENIIISGKNFGKNLQIQMIIQPTRKKIVFHDQTNHNHQKQVQQKQFQISLPIRISLINNSITPVIHVLDFSTKLKLQSLKFGQSNILKAQLNLIQIDNQISISCLYPVILTTSMKLVFQNSKNNSLSIQFQQINLKIQEDLFKPLLELKSFINNLLNYQSQAYNKNLLQSNAKVQKKVNNSDFFISKLVLPKIVINLEIQTKKFSIQTTVVLEKPQITTFPFKQFPYPIQSIALNILSHLSISPWAFITSFKKGIQILINQQSAGKAVQGFFGTILGAFSNILTGVLGFIVGYDVQKVDNLIEGIDQGVCSLFREIRQIPQFQNTQCNLTSILQGTGKTLINLVFKPIKGVLRMTLKITQGIKKTALFSFDLANKVKTRYPIVFYNRQQYFLAYDQQQSRNLKKFKQITGNKLEYFYLVKFFKIELLFDKAQLLLVIGTQNIILINLTKRKVNWIIDILRIKKIQIVDICKLRIILYDQYEMNPYRNISRKDKIVSQNNENEFQLFLINQMQAKQFMDSYIKVRKLSKIQF